MDNEGHVINMWQIMLVCSEQRSGKAGKTAMHELLFIMFKINEQFIYFFKHA